MDKNGNCFNGTVVDRGVTEARSWDFFLQAHSALQGTAKPAHYFVVHDEIFVRNTKSGNPADDLENLTHNMCYLFGRATKSVSICPPAYYADLACDRGRRYLSGLFEVEKRDYGSGKIEPTLEPYINDGFFHREGGDGKTVKIHDNLKDTMFYI